MATYNVTNSTNSGQGSLRETVALANTNEGKDTIFVQTEIVQLDSPIKITDSVELGTPYGSTIQQSGSGRIFTIDDSSEVNLDVDLFRLSLTGGNSELYGGAIYNAENLQIVDSHLYVNSAFNRGGAIYHTNGSLNISSSLIEGNSVVNNNHTPSSGGGLYVKDAELMIDSSIIKNNQSIKGSSLTITGASSAAIYSSTLDNDFSQGSITIYDSQLEIKDSTIKGDALISDYQIIDDRDSGFTFNNLIIETGYNYQDTFTGANGGNTTAVKDLSCYDNLSIEELEFPIMSLIDDTFVDRSGLMPEVLVFDENSNG